MGTGESATPQRDRERIADALTHDRSLQAAPPIGTSLPGP